VAGLGVPGSGNLRMALESSPHTNLLIYSHDEIENA
jgi:hypothetical protein